MEEKEIVGVVSKRNNEYYVTTEDGTIYSLYAINPWESVPTDFDTGKFEQFVNNKVRVAGRFKGTEIWNALVHCLDEKDTIPPRIDDLLPQEE